jgi:hypothetical protein
MSDGAGEIRRLLQPESIPAKPKPAADWPAERRNVLRLTITREWIEYTGTAIVAKNICEVPREIKKIPPHQRISRADAEG